MLRTAILLLCLLFVGAAQAQEIHGFTPCVSSAGAQTISASNSSSGVVLSACGPSVMLFNVGSQEAFYRLSSNNSAATTSDYSIPGNSYILLTVPNLGATYYLNAITASSTTTLRVSQGNAQ